MADPTYVDIDPVTKQPYTGQTASPSASAPAQESQQQPPPFDAEKFAADSATRQMMYAVSRGGRPTQEDFEKSRQAAYSQYMETMRQMALDKQRSQTELQRQETMRTFEQFGPREMSSDETKDAAGLTNAHDAIMMLYHQNADIPENDAYRTTLVGDPAAVVGKMTDPRVRLYEAARGGNIITLGRGLLQDTGQVAGKEEAQELIKNLMPGPGDSTQMAARKTIDMLQMQMNGIKAKIDGMPANVDTTPLKTAYARSYADYAGMVNQYGSDAQKNWAAADPRTLWGNTAPGLVANMATVQPAVKAGVSASTNAALNAQASGLMTGATTTIPGGQAWQPVNLPRAVPSTPISAYPTITSDQGSVPSSALAALINTTSRFPQPGGIIKQLLPNTGGPDNPALTLPPELANPNPREWGQ